MYTNNEEKDITKIIIGSMVTYLVVIILITVVYLFSSNKKNILSFIFAILVILTSFLMCGNFGHTLLELDSSYDKDANTLEKEVANTRSNILTIISWIIVITIYTNSLSLININDDLKQYISGIILLLPFFIKNLF